jgi:predicted ATP-grasp superfamily ATP-dependent carboligase
MRVDCNVFHHGTLGVIRSLGRAGIEVHALVYGPTGPSTRSRYLHRLHARPTRPAGAAQLLAGLAAVSDQIGRRCLLIPVDDVGALFVAEHSPALADRFLLPAQPPAVPRRLADKAALAALCADLGVPHPEVFLPRSGGAVAEAVRALGLPLVAKWSQPWLLPSRSGLRSTAVLGSAAEVAALHARTPVAGSQLVLQRFLPPTAGGDWFFQGYLDGSSVWVAGGTGRKERAYPTDAGLTTLGRWLPNPELAALAVGVIDRVGYRGVLDLDFRYDPDSGRHLLVDFNPRLGAQFRLFTDAQGLDLVRAQHLDLTGREVPPWRPRYGRAFVVENYDLLSALHAWSRRRLDLAGWRRSLRPVQESAWFARDDLAPFAAMGLRSVQQRLQRLCGAGAAGLAGSAGGAGLAGSADGASLAGSAGLAGLPADPAAEVACGQFRQREEDL